MVEKMGKKDRKVILIFSIIWVNTAVVIAILVVVGLIKAGASAFIDSYGMVAFLLLVIFCSVCYNRFRKYFLS